MAKITGVGGIFFKSPNPKALADWYSEHLGLTLDEGYIGASFAPDTLPANGATVLGFFEQNTEYFAPAKQDYMINFMVDNLAEALQQVQAGGATLAGEPESYDYGEFGWFIDPDGNKIELWQPK